MSLLHVCKVSLSFGFLDVQASIFLYYNCVLSIHIFWNLSKKVNTSGEGIQNKSFKKILERSPGGCIVITWLWFVGVVDRHRFPGHFRFESRGVTLSNGRAVHNKQQRGNCKIKRKRRSPRKQ